MLSNFELVRVARQRAVTTSPKLIIINSTGKPIKKQSGAALEGSPRGAARRRKTKMRKAAGLDFLNRLTFRLTTLYGYIQRK